MGGNVYDVGQDGARTPAHYDNSHELLYTSRDVFFLPSDATSGRTKVYVLVVYSALPKMSPSSTAQLTTFSSPEAALLLVSTKNRDLWPSPTAFRF